MIEWVIIDTPQRRELKLVDDGSKMGRFCFIFLYNKILFQKEYYILCSISYDIEIFLKNCVRWARDRRQ